jgi:nucleoside-diphosphate-sugar epimerase
VDDLASACAFLLENYSSADIINIGCGWEISIREAAEIIRDIVGYQGEICWDTTQPDGNPRRCSTSAAWKNSAGRRRPTSAKAWLKPTSGSSTIAPPPAS